MLNEKRRYHISNESHIYVTLPQEGEDGKERVMSDTAMICFFIIVICTIVNIASYIIAEVKITRAKKKLEELERRTDEKL